MYVVRTRNIKRGVKTTMHNAAAGIIKNVELHGETHAIVHGAYEYYYSYLQVAAVRRPVRACKK